MHIHRKILFGAAALALPVSALTTIAFGADAYAGKPPPPPPITATCTVAAGTVAFGAPGLSSAGSQDTSKTSTTNVTGGNINCTGTNGGTGSGSIGAGGSLSIATKSTKCKGPNDPAGTGCQTKGDYGYSSWGAFASNGVSSLEKSLKKLPITIGSTTLSTKLTGASEIVGAPCNNASRGGTEVGFGITYTVKGPKADKGQTVQVNACLGATTGPGENAAEMLNFFQAVSQQIGTTATATIDTTDSSVTIS